MNALGAPEPGLPSQAFATQRGTVHMLWTIFVIVLILWLLGFSFHIAGSLIHLLLVVALIILIFNLVLEDVVVVKRVEPRQCWRSPSHRLRKPEICCFPAE